MTAHRRFRRELVFRLDISPSRTAFRIELLTNENLVVSRTAVYCNGRKCSVQSNSVSTGTGVHADYIHTLITVFSFPEIHPFEFALVRTFYREKCHKAEPRIGCANQHIVIGNSAYDTQICRELFAYSWEH